jgi:hypothetical protein
MHSCMAGSALHSLARKSLFSLWVVDGVVLVPPRKVLDLNGKHLIFRLNFPPNFRLNYLRVLGLGFRV